MNLDSERAGDDHDKKSETVPDVRLHNALPAGRFRSAAAAGAAGGGLQPLRNRGCDSLENSCC